MDALTLLAILAATHAAAVCAGIAIGRGRDGKVRAEIASFGTQFLSEMQANMVTQSEVDALQREVSELMNRLNRAENAHDSLYAIVDRLQERLAAIEAPARPVQAQRIIST